MSTTRPTGAVLVSGAGIAGIQASLDLAESGFKVYLLEPSLAIGGRMAMLDKTFPTGDCAMCILSPKLVAVGRNKNIEILTMGRIESVAGEPGRLEVVIRQEPRYVDAARCNACGECSLVCPVSLPSEFDRGLGPRKAIFRPYPQAIPNVFGIVKSRGRAPCRALCPAGVNAQGYVALVGQRRFQEAYALIRERCPLPAVCGRICHHPCQTKCNRSDVDQPVAVRDLKRFAADYVHAHGLVGEATAAARAPEKLREERIAVIGAGPAGLTAADDLQRLGYRVTVFESRPFLGGMLRMGVPAYRLPRDVLDRECGAIAGGRVEVRHGVRFGREVTAESLKKDGYAATFIATGAHKSRTMDLPGIGAKGVHYGLDFLCRANLGEQVPVGRHAVVVGGGNVAMDAARAALRLGAQDVTVVYRRSRKEMPALDEEIEGAEQEGVRFRLLANPVRVLADASGAMTGLECVRMELGEPDAGGRRRPVEVRGSNFTVEADTLLVAIGQEADLGGFPVGPGGKLVCDDSLATAVPGVFAGGDVVLGPASLVEAMAHGHRGAEAIHRFLRGENGNTAAAAGAAEPYAPNPQPDAPAAPQRAMPKAEVRTRMADFREVDLGYSEEDAVAEARRCLNCGICSECGLCVSACKPGAIHHGMTESRRTLQVGAVLLTPGFEEFDPALSGEYGHGRYPNVLSSVQFERMLSAAGPTEGSVLRPSDGRPAKRIAFLQCVGSRDSKRGRGFCSSICCMAATKEAVVAMEHLAGLQATIFCMDVRAFGKEFDRYVDRARDAQGVRFVRAIPSRVVQMPGSLNPRVRYFDEQGAERQEEFDLVVLSVGMQPGASVGDLAERLGIGRNEFGFCQTDRFSPMLTSRPGVFVAGAFQEPKDIPESVAQASGAAGCAMELLARARGTLIARREYPWERDVTDEEPRIGLFVCHCGHNIASVVDVKAVVEAARKLPNVVYAEENLYTCSDTSQTRIRDLMLEHRLNRLVVASCSPRTHEVLFQETLRESGLNPYLFAMANIRDQCSWVHREDPVEATRKAVDLMRMAVGRARWLRALETGRLAVTHSALVVGGGLAGLTAAQSLADQGFDVDLVEKEAALGGNLRRLHTTLEGADVQAQLARLIGGVGASPRIRVHLQSEVVEVAGHVGSFKSRIRTPRETVAIAHGVIVMATGGVERPTDRHLHGRHPRVVTQRELEAHLAAAGGSEPAKRNGGDPALVASLGEAPTVVMIQCVGSRTDEHPYCSRVCCAAAVKNALSIKARMPDARVFVLARDIRTYGFRELDFEKARRAGVLFIRHEQGRDPEVRDEGGLRVTVTDAATRRPLTLEPDLLVLSTGIAPAPDTPSFSELLRTSLSADGFFLEAHPKLRPVDLASEGIFVCGLAHSPRFIDETIAQARAAAARAATVLSKSHLEVPGQVSKVDPQKCIACMTCVKVCPYGAPMMGESQRAEIQAAKCMGCGSCGAECPAKAITLQHQEERQAIAMLDELLVGGPR